MPYEFGETSAAPSGPDASLELFRDLHGTPAIQRSDCDRLPQEIEKMAGELTEAIKNPNVNTEQMRELVRKDFEQVKATSGYPGLVALAGKVSDSAGVKMRVDQAVLPGVYSVLTELKGQLMLIPIY